VPDERFPTDDATDARLRSALLDVAPDVPGSGILPDVERRAHRRRRRVRESIGASAVVLLGGLAVAGYALETGTPLRANGPSVPVRPSPTTPITGSTPQSLSTASGQSFSRAYGSQPPPDAPPCPAHQTTPSTVGGRFCGPSPGPGNGSGPDGVCSGTETVPPCGHGVIPDRYYAYTMPGTCDGLVTFDGRRWVSELPPPSPSPDFDVWIRLGVGGSVRWISPSGAVGLAPYVGQPLSGCRR